MKKITNWVLSLSCILCAPFNLCADTAIDDLIESPPSDIIGPDGTADRNFTNWKLFSLTRESITYRAIINGLTILPDRDFLFSEGYFTNYSDSAPLISGSPTGKFKASTMPADIPGGTWKFSYQIEFRPADGLAEPIAYWTWTENSPTNGLLVDRSLSLNQAVRRATRSKKTRKSLLLLQKQSRYLKALDSEQ